MQLVIRTKLLLGGGNAMESIHMVIYKSYTSHTMGLAPANSLLLKLTENRSARLVLVNMDIQCFD